MDGVFWGSRAKAGLTYSNPKELGFGKGRGSYLKRKRRRLWEAGEIAYHRGGWESYQEITCDSGLFSRACAQGRG